MHTPVIGLEIHAQLKTKSKMFCSCVNDPEVREPNIYVCPICLGHPGTLPVANSLAIKKVITAGIALNCKIADISRFDRKNYFYPDLPKGYQISQDMKPLCSGGYLEVKGKKIRINRIHLEEDTGRLIHDEKKEHSLVDFNRAGVPLMELVTEPDFRSAEEVKSFAEELRLIFRYLDISEANMNQGQMRVEVNISLTDKDGNMGTKVEVKNLNSFRAAYKAVLYETERQKEVLENNGKIIQETRGWNENTEKTFSQRKKEKAYDYRYFPEPDLPPLYLNEEPFKKDEIKIDKELPIPKRKRFKEEYKIDDEKEIENFITDEELSNYFEEVVRKAIKSLKEEEVNDKNKKDIFGFTKSYILTELLGIIQGRSLKEVALSSDNFADFIILVFRKEISSKIAKVVLREMIMTSKKPLDIIKEKGLSQINDDEEIRRIVLDVINENKGAVKDYKEGKKEVIQFLVGQVMAKTKGRAVPSEVNNIFKEKLE